jgi:hypothetical protein
MRLSRPLLLVCVLGALIAAGAGTAQAQGGASAPAQDRAAGVLAGCYPENVSVRVDRSGHHIRGSGGFFNCTGSRYANIELQRHRWYGWQPLRSWSGTFVPGIYYWLFYDCTNTGTHTFRTIMWGRRVDGTPWFRESNHYRTTC